MPYSAMIFLILTILSALLGSNPTPSGLAEGARILALAFAILFVVTLALPYVRRFIQDSDKA